MDLGGSVDVRILAALHRLLPNVEFETKLLGSNDRFESQTI